MPEFSRSLRSHVFSVWLSAVLAFAPGCDGPLTSGLVIEPLPEALAPASEGPCAFEAIPDVRTDNALCPSGTYSGDVRLVNGRFEALQGCVRVAGSVHVELSSSDQLRALDALQVVDGALVITAFSGLDAAVRPSRGLDELRCVAGDVSLSRESPVNGLRKLREVGGSFTIAAGALQDGAVLTDLQRVWGDLSAPVSVRMPALETIYGRLGPQPWASPERRAASPRLSYVGCSPDFTPCRDGVLGCDFDVRDQRAVSQLAECKHARADLQLQAADIYDLTALSRLQTVRGQLSIGPLSGAGALPSLDGLDQLRSVGALSVQNLPELEDLQGLGMLEHAGNIDIRACSRLQDLFGLDTLREVRGRLRLVNNAALTSLSGVPSLRELDELVIDGNASITSLRGAPSQVARLTALTVEHNPRLKTLDGADELARARNLFVSNNAQLVRLGRFPQLRSLDLLEVADNPRLTELGEFPMLVGGEDLELTLRNNDRLSKLSGLERVARAYNVSVIGCNELTSMTGLKITEIRNLLVVLNNSALSTLDGLDSLREVSFIKIQANPSLVDLGGLSGLRGSAASIELRNNFALADTSMLAGLGLASVYVDNEGL
jgi:hypothetical protein